MATPELAALESLLPELSKGGHGRKIVILGWHLLAKRNQTRFKPPEVEKLYSVLHIAPPSGFSGYFQHLVAQGTLLKDKMGYRLESATLAELNLLLGTRAVTIQLTELLSTLPARVPDLAERTYLDEALICYRHKAFRAAVVMTWNLAFHHLCSHVLTKRLADFNARWIVSFPGHHKQSPRQITAMDDFSRDLRESQILEICKAAGIVTADMGRILSENLGRRNSAAHPSDVIIEQLQVDAMIDDLVRNVVLKIT